MKNIFKNKSILITGASGSIGSSLISYLSNKNCKVIRAVSNDENGLTELSNKFENPKKNYISQMREKKIRYIYCDINNLEKCKLVTKNIDIVIHAAALKHVPFCEFNPFEATEVNVIGTINMIKAALKNNIDKFLFVSTDKVVDPSSCMGATKLLSEKIVTNSNYLVGDKKTKFSIVRFGNVIFSRGSVIPKFINNILLNEKLSITDKSMERYFMTIKDTSELITKSLFMMKGGEIFVPANLKIFKILDLVNVLKIIFSKKDIKYQIIGKRTGEKLFESLISENEFNHTKIVNDTFIIDKKINNSKNNYLKAKRKYKTARVLDKKSLFNFLKKEIKNSKTYI